MLRTATLILASLVPLGTGCMVSDEEPGDGFDVTLQSDGKTDDISGLHVRWTLGETHDWFNDGNPELGVMVARRGGTLMLLNADVAHIKPLKADGKTNYTPNNVVTIGIEPTSTNVEMAFAFVDGAALAMDRLQPLACGGTQMFKTLAIDFTKSELVVDGMTHVPFAQCNITLDPRDATAFNSKTFALLGVPLRTLDGSTFSGTYRYKHTVTVR
jgi:hypothetical protein